MMETNSLQKKIDKVAMVANCKGWIDDKEEARRAIEDYLENHLGEFFSGGQVTENIESEVKWRDECNKRLTQ